MHSACVLCVRKSSHSCTVGADTTIYLRCYPCQTVELEECEEDCWRLIQVPASTSLAVLHDQILGPAMGWSRGYHGYVFLDPRDGTIMGPKKNDGYLDMMHVNI